MLPRHNPYTPGQFFLRQDQLPNPLPGMIFFHLFPAGYSHQLSALSFHFQCDGNPADRYIVVAALDSADRYLFATSHQTKLVAGQSGRFYVGAGFVPRVPTSSLIPTTLSWPANLIIPGRNQLMILAMDIQPTDQISSIFLIEKQWFST